LYNKYLVIITAENKEKYISNTIKSCLNQKLCKKLKILVVYSKLSNENTLKNDFKSFKNIIFLKDIIKKKLPTQDQLYKIERASSLISNEWVLLLDGDDLFDPHKISYLDKLKLKKDHIYLNDFVSINKNSANSYYKRKVYKELLLYKKLFNDWPEKINTSSIVLHGNLLKNFYKVHNPYKWKFLAIDVQLILFYFYKNKFVHLDKILTFKKENINNLDKTFTNYFKKKYWVRRYEQHKMTEQLSNKINFVDRLLTIFFKNILK
jgi:hypothetical protein|tara:strand:- start:354 stop:1145 length:792 start_codon:yes stop_codon:yes gene_type:complete